MRKISMKRKLCLPALLTCFVFSLSFSSCLKTRAQLKGESQDEGKDSGPKPIPAQVQDVQPQGQYVIDEIKSEMTRMTGRIDDLERAKQDSSSSGPTKDDFKKLETKLIELEQAQIQMLEAIKKLQTSAPPPNNQEAFEKAKKHYTAGEYDLAVENFSAYLKNPKAKNAEDAVFLRGEAYFQLKQYKKAIVDYSKFPEKYTKSKYLPQSLYRIGQSFEALGMKEDAKNFYQELVEKFPKFAAAKKVKAKLK